VRELGHASRPFCRAPPRPVSFHRSFLLIAAQPLNSTVPCKCLYSLANLMLSFSVVSLANPSTSFYNRLSPSCSFGFYTHIVTSTQIVPFFSTASKQATRRNSYSFIRFMDLLHTSCHHGGGGADPSQIVAQVTKCNAFFARTEQSRIQSARCKAGLEPAGLELGSLE
jgi:hypothetical protein